MSSGWCIPRWEKVQCCTMHKIRTWNTKHEPTSTGNCQARSGIAKCCSAWCQITKMDWHGTFPVNNYKVFYYGNDKLRINGVALLLRHDVPQAVRGYNTRSDRIMSVRLLGKPTNISITQVYVPTTKGWRRWNWKLSGKYPRRNWSHTKTRHANNYRCLEYKM